MTLLAAEEIRRFGISRGWRCCRTRASAASDAPSAHKMREALQLIIARAPDLEVDGEMHGDAALSKRSAATNFRIRGSRRGQLADHAQRRRGQHHVQRCGWRPAKA